MSYKGTLKANDGNKIFPETETGQIVDFTAGVYNTINNDNMIFLCGDSSSNLATLSGGLPVTGN
jgi:hypothetical protein